MHSDSVLYQTIREGRVDEIFSQTGVRTMPPFEDVLSPRQIRAVITYLKTMWNREQRLYQWEASQEEPFPTEAGQNEHPAPIAEFQPKSRITAPAILRRHSLGPP